MLVDATTSLPRLSSSLRLIIVGDVVGEPGMAMCAKWLPKLKTQLEADGIMINGENSAKDGRGITKQTMDSLLTAGADAITTGNHVWRHNDFLPILNNSAVVVRPANFPLGSPGKGYCLVEIAGHQVAVINLMGRVFFKEHTNCPFLTVKDLLAEIKPKTNLVVVDFHAEATSEKSAMGHFLDGQASVVVGTHTHVQTADARVLPNGTAFITDLGCVAALDSCIGVEKEIIIEHLLTQLPARFKVAKITPMVLSGIVVDLDLDTGKALQVLPLRIID